MEEKIIRLERKDGLKYTPITVTLAILHTNGELLSEALDKKAEKKDVAKEVKNIKKDLQTLETDLEKEIVLVLLTAGNNISITNKQINAIGYTYNSGNGSFVEGISLALGSNSHAEGNSTTANGPTSHAEGEYSNAYGYASHAEGQNTVASGNYSHTLGLNTKALNESEHAEGSYNKSNTPFNVIPEGFVDLGLASGTLWSAYNLGALPDNTKESYFGHYYQWGDPEPADSKTCNWNNYKFGSSSPFSKYDNDGKTLLEAVDDPVTVALGDKYHSPTKAQIQELLALTNTWVTDYNSISGLNGIIFTGTNGNTLFIPASGYRSDSAFYGHESYLCLWSNSLGVGGPDNALNFYSSYSGDDFYLGNGSRCLGFSVRAVITLHPKYTRHSIGIGTDENSRANAVEVMDNGDTYIKGIGSYDGTNPQNANDLATVISSLETRIANLESHITWA